MKFHQTIKKLWKMRRQVSAVHADAFDSFRDFGESPMMGRRCMETVKILRARNDVREPSPCRKSFARSARVMIYVCSELVEGRSNCGRLETCR